MKYIITLSKRDIQDRTKLVEMFFKNLSYKSDLVGMFKLSESSAILVRKKKDKSENSSLSFDDCLSIFELTRPITLSYDVDKITHSYCYELINNTALEDLLKSATVIPLEKLLNVNLVTTIASLRTYGTLGFFRMLIDMNVTGVLILSPISYVEFKRTQKVVKDTDVLITISEFIKNRQSVLNYLEGEENGIFVKAETRYEDYRKHGTPVIMKATLYNSFMDMHNSVIYNEEIAKDKTIDTMRKYLLEAIINNLDDNKEAPRRKVKGF